MSFNILIPLHHAQYLAIHNIHKGRDVRTPVPPEETDEFMSIKNNYPVIYEYMINKYPDRFKDGDTIEMEEKNTKKGKATEGTGKILATISKITTNYLGEKARVKVELPPEPPKEPPKAEPPKEAVVSDTGAVVAPKPAPEPAPAPAVEPLVMKSDTGAVQPEEDLSEPVRKQGEAFREYLDRWTSYIHKLHKKAVENTFKINTSINLDLYSFDEEKKKKRLQPLKDEIIDKYFANTFFGYNYNPATQPESLATLRKPYQPISMDMVMAVMEKRGIRMTANLSLDLYDKAFQKVFDEMIQPFEGGFFSYNAKGLLNNKELFLTINLWMNALTIYVNGFRKYLATFKPLVKESSLPAIAKINEAYARAHLQNLYNIVQNNS